MTWLVFGVSCLLVLAGAVSIISGAPIIQLERGWAEVISGTVALSSGGVVFALAGILMRLESIRDTLASRTMPVAAETVPVVAERTALTEKVEVLPPVPAEPTEPQTAPPMARAESPPAPEPAAQPAEMPAQTDDGSSQGLWKRVKRPDTARPEAAALVQNGFPDRVIPEASRDIETDDKPVLVPAHPIPPAPAVVPVEPTPEPVALATQEEAQIGWLERSLFKGRPPRHGAEIPTRTEPTVSRSTPDEPADRFEPSIVPATSVRPVMPVLSTPEPVAIAEPEPTPDLQSEQHQGATVVGRYQAGSASYVMYSDGTIEVETESGETHRFGSMDELKAFIAQQDTTVS